MALTLGDNFSYQGAKPLDARLKYETVAAMKAVADATMYDGCLAYCAGTDKTYQWKSGNTVDETTGKWREFNSGGGGGGGETYTAGDGIDISAENEISTEKSEAGWMDEVIEKVPMSGPLVNIANAFNHADLYSETEKIVGQWIDGKPIYQKTFTFKPSSYGSGSQYVLPASLTGLNFHVATIDFELWSVWYECIHSGVLSPRSSDDALILNNATIPYPSIDHRMTVRYTKTADSAIAIGSENEYSTTEKIVGTWIDGKPIYQKTVDCGALPNAGQSSVSHNIANIDIIPNFWGIGINQGGTSLKIPGEVTGSNHASAVGCYVNRTEIGFLTYNDRSGYHAYVTIQYTKTSS